MATKKKKTTAAPRKKMKPPKAAPPVDKMHELRTLDVLKTEEVVQLTGRPMRQIRLAIANGSLLVHENPSRAVGNRIMRGALDAYLSPNTTAEVLTVEGAAALARVKAPTIELAIERGELAATRNERGHVSVRRVDVLAWLGAPAPAPAAQAG